MPDTIALYRQRLHLQNANFSRIDHEEAMVAIVYKVTPASGAPLILKISARTNDYLREVYFLKHFADLLPVPRIMQVVEPQPGIHGAILMECLPGKLLTTTAYSEKLAYEIGSCLARIHLNPVAGYGDLIQPQDFSPDPCLHFALKFEEGFAECSNHLPKALIEKCRRYFDEHINLLATPDGPCMVHRDFRPGNVIVHDGKLQGIIDWASARASFAEEDFCPLEHGEWPTHPTLKKSFLAGYASCRPVPDYTAMMPLLRLSKAIATIGFTVKCETWDTSHARVYQFNRRFLETFF
jgi:Ser/Thr protein kinase RdoA (MazF antagonist)